MSNNYNNNKDGISVEFCGHYDTDLSNIEYKDNFTTLEKDNRCETSVIFFNDCGQFKTPAITDLLSIKGSTKDMQKYIEKELGGFHIVNREECINEIVCQNFCEFKEFCDDEYYYEYTLNKYNLQLIKTKKYKVYESRGYCQGDFIYVIVDNGNCNESLVINLIWDCPIYIRLTIEGVEYYGDEYLDDKFLWDKDSFIENFMASYITEISLHNTELRKELENLIPEELKY